MSTAGIGWICLGMGVLWIVYVYAGYPVALALLAWIKGRPHTSRDDHHPRVSVLIAARNEEKDIGWKVDQTLGWDYPADRLEVLVASDASDDDTENIVRSNVGPRLRLIVMERRGGKVRALNQLALESRAEVLFFTDANASIDRGALRRMVRHLADAGVGCVTGRTSGAGAGGGAVVGGGASVYWDLEALVARMESRLGAVLVCDGAIHCMRRQLYEDLLPDLANDLEMPIRVRARGYLSVFEPDATAVERDTQSPGEEFQRRRRICGQGMLAAWRLRDLLSGMLAWQFFTHKCLRWLTALPMALILVGSVLAMPNPMAAGCLAFQGAFYGAAAIAALMGRTGTAVNRVLAVPFYIVLGTAGALAGVLDTCLGRRFDIWETPALSRGGVSAGTSS